MKSPIAKRSIIVRGHKTSISLEPEFWSAIKDIAAEQRLAVSRLVSMVDEERGEVGNLSSALRCFVLARYRSADVPATASPEREPHWHRQPQPATP